MKISYSDAQKRTYYIEEKDGLFYAYYTRVMPVETLFDVSRTREQAEQAIEDHKAGTNSTQYTIEIV